MNLLPRWKVLMIDGTEHVLIDPDIHRKIDTTGQPWMGWADTDQGIKINLHHAIYMTEVAGSGTDSGRVAVGGKGSRV